MNAPDPSGSAHPRPLRRDARPPQGASPYATVANRCGRPPPVPQRPQGSPAARRRQNPKGSLVQRELSPNGRLRDCRHAPSTPRRRPVDQPGGTGHPLWDSTPIFFLVGPKKKTAVEPSKEKTLIAGQSGALRPPTRRDAGCNCSAQSNQPLRNHGRSPHQTSEPPAPCCTAQLSGKDRIDQLLFPRSPLRSALPGHSRPAPKTTAPPPVPPDLLSLPEPP